MIRKQLSPVTGHVRVTFELPSCIWADRIAVCGDFNEWSRTAMPLKQGRDGVWRASIDLAANQLFEFRYFIDGNWHTDYHADGSRPNDYGSDNSVIDTTMPAMLVTDSIRDSGDVVRDARPLEMPARLNGRSPRKEILSAA